MRAGLRSLTALRGGSSLLRPVARTGPSMLQRYKSTTAVQRDTMTGEIISLPDIDVRSAFSYFVIADIRSAAVTTQNRTSQEPKDAAPVLQVDLWKDIYRPYAHGSLVE